MAYADVKERILLIVEAVTPTIKPLVAFRRGKGRSPGAKIARTSGGVRRIQLKGGVSSITSYANGTSPHQRKHRLHLTVIYPNSMGEDELDEAIEQDKIDIGTALENISNYVFATSRLQNIRVPTQTRALVNDAVQVRYILETLYLES